MLGVDTENKEELLHLYSKKTLHEHTTTQQDGRIDIYLLCDGRISGHQESWYNVNNQSAEELAISLMFREHLAEIKDWNRKDDENDSNTKAQVGYDNIKINMINSVSVK